MGERIDYLLQWKRLNEQREAKDGKEEETPEENEIEDEESEVEDEEDKQPEPEAKPKGQAAGKVSIYKEHRRNSNFRPDENSQG